MGSLVAISLVKNIASKADDDKLPSLLSMVIEGLPPYTESKYVHKAENYFKQYVKRYEHLPSLDTYCRHGLLLSSYTYSGVISLDCLVAMSTFYAFVFLLDDLFFDIPDKNLMEPYGIPRSALSSPQKMQEYLDHLVAVFGQQTTPHTLIETMMCEVGREILALSNPKWFHEFLHCFDEYLRVSIASYADIVVGHNACFQDLRSYTEMCTGNGGRKFILLLTEFASDTYVPTAMRLHPYMQKVTIAATIFIGFVNDVFSYHKESTEEGGNPRNLVMVLMDSEGKSFVQAAQQAVELVNQYTSSILEMEGEVASNLVLKNHACEIRAFLAGNLYFNCMSERYRQLDSMFLELRDGSTSWKAFVESRSRTTAVV